MDDEWSITNFFYSINFLWKDCCKKSCKNECDLFDSFMYLKCMKCTSIWLLQVSLMWYVCHSLIFIGKFGRFSLNSKAFSSKFVVKYYFCTKYIVIPLSGSYHQLHNTELPLETRFVCLPKKQSSQIFFEILSPHVS